MKKNTKMLQKKLKIAEKEKANKYTKESIQRKQKTLVLYVGVDFHHQTLIVSLTKACP